MAENTPWLPNRFSRHDAQTGRLIDGYPHRGHFDSGFVPDIDAE